MKQEPSARNIKQEDERTVNSRNYKMKHRLRRQRAGRRRPLEIKMESTN
jgi:hypothetical protein